MASNETIRKSSPPAKPYTTWEEEHVNGDELDIEELIRIEEAAGASNIDSSTPTRYSSQTIRQKKGRQLASTMRASPFGPTTIATTSSSTPSSTSSSPFSSSHSLKQKDEELSPTTSEERVDITTPNKIINTGSVGGSKGSVTFPSVGLYQGLGRLGALSAITFGAFGLVHLIPPVLGSIGGVDLANKALIWGRVYYQTYGVEQVLVYGSLAVHIGTGLCRAIVRFIWKSKSYYASTRPVTDSEYAGRPVSSKGTITTTTITTTTAIMSSRSGTSISSTSSSDTPDGTGSVGNGSGGSGTAPGLFPYHRLVGWILTPLVLGHMNTMRWAPIKAFGDSSMLDYSFVTFLHRLNRPAPYFLLVCLMTYHMIGGMPVAFNMAIPKGSTGRIKTQDLIKSRKLRLVVTGLISTVALVGTYRIMNAEGVIPMARLYRSML
ncbi:hypothetical protein BGZ46_005164 [Entomortierella lignicola]|nr:hypothetical protein BGZ46_005164 [Entomortierella lignicola]